MSEHAPLPPMPLPPMPLPPMPRSYRGGLAFLHEQEAHGGDLYGHSAYWPEGSSGVTLDPGYDLGHGKPELLRHYERFLTEGQLAACHAALGCRGRRAHRLLTSDTEIGAQLRSILLSREEAGELLPALAAPYWRDIARRFTFLTAGVPRGRAVPKSVQEVLLSLAYNRGAGNRDLEQLRAPLNEADYEEVARRIEQMEEQHGRRAREAEHLRAGLPGDASLVQRGLRRVHPLPAEVLGGAGAFVERFRDQFGWSVSDAQMDAPARAAGQPSRASEGAAEKVTHDRIIRKVKWGGVWGLLGSAALALIGWVEPSMFSFLGPLAPLLVVVLQFGASFWARSSTRDFPAFLSLDKIRPSAMPLTTKDKQTSQNFFYEVLDEVFDDEGDKQLAIEKANELIDLPGVTEQGEAVILEQIANGLLLAYHATKPEGEN